MAKKFSINIDKKSKQNSQLISSLKLEDKQNKIASHMAVLEAFGHSSIDELGTVELGKSNSKEILLQTSGVVLPSDEGLIDVKFMNDKFNAIFDPLSRRKSSRTSETVFSVIKTTPPNSSAGRSTSNNIIPVDRAYIFSNEIIIPDNTEILIDSGVKMLVIISNNLTIGNNVKITWKQPEITTPDPTPKRNSRSNYPTASGTVSENGSVGLTGFSGYSGQKGDSAPEIEFWFLNLTGDFPMIDLKGQNGQNGGKGGDGGNGQNGQNGCSTAKKRLSCLREKGPGGNGGNGGTGGDGGTGGEGGDGGKLTVFTTSSNIISMNQSGFTPDLTRGIGGNGGDSGNGGQGGLGGKKGSHDHDVCRSNQRANGRRGYVGKSGQKGVKGINGNSFQNSLRLEPITQSEFNIALTKPAIVSTNKQGSCAYVGDTITVHGLRFSNTDIVYIQDENEQLTIACTTTYIADNLLTFKVPHTIGGYIMFQVRQSDDTRSNYCTLLIGPKIETIIPALRIKPGSEVYLKGTGFDLNGSIRINNQDTGAYEWIDYETIKYKVFRPLNVTRNQAGEEVKLKVINSTGVGSSNFNHSEEIDVILDTYNILAVGCSSGYNVGNTIHNKDFTKVKNYLEAKFNIGVYITVEAHVGAVIGKGNDNHFSKMPGGLSTLAPTVNEQIVNAAQQNPSPFHLVIVSAGANPFMTPHMMEKRATPSVIQSFKTTIEESCYHDLKDLLWKTQMRFPKANILVKSYYHIFSSQSKASSVTLFTLTMNIAMGQIVGNNDLKQKIIDLSTLTGDINVTAAERAKLNDVWVSESTKNIKRAVDEVNAESNTNQRAFFVDAETKPENAAHAPQSFLWEPQMDSVTLRASDPMLAARTAIIDNQYPNKIESRGYSPFFSKRDSSYHPNVAGAQRYFEKMKLIIDDFKESRNVVLTSFSGDYLSLNTGSKKLTTSSNGLISDSILEMIDFGNNKVAFKSASGEFVCAEQAGGLDVNVNRQKALGWEMFVLQPLGNSMFAIVTNNGHYLSVASDGTVNATSSTISSSEKFKIK